MRQNEIAHHHFGTIRRLRKGNPASETEWSRRGETLNRDLQIVSRNVHFQNVGFEITFFVEGFQDFFILAGDVLAECGRGVKYKDSSGKHQRCSDRFKHSYLLISGLKTVSFDVLSLQALSKICVQGVIHGKLTRKAFLIADAGRCKPLCYCTQPNAFRRNMFLPLDIGSSHD